MSLFETCFQGLEEPRGQDPRPACRAQPCNVSGSQPIFAPTELIAARCEARPSLCSNTIRTVRLRTSGAYLRHRAIGQGASAPRGTKSFRKILL